MTTVRWTRIVPASFVLFVSMPRLARPQNACDLNQDGSVNVVDVQWATNMALGLMACSASINGPGVCNVVVIERVIHAALGGICLTDSGGSVNHSASLTWAASTSPNVSGYNVYRSTTSGSGYKKINSALITGGTSYTDTTVQAGQTYYYVATAVDSSNNESAYSNEAKAVVPTP